ncbi:efflux RND transporter periplasmic adaptor subunit [Poseidonocella sp. HB161398]|uniref:efflux RND transporter periplasmic adaptor subunit n=1 Tax=Poseidonocella sp. HB161398 TaxID=2320855 RepID=UPI0011087005|nr:efflux RND transporter periplasmic adaptor subunit [Poseidonocella sp. HB161398]
MTPRLPLLIAAVALVASCREEAATAPEPVRPVRVAVAQSSAAGESIRLTGEIRAQDSAVLSFRTGGRLLERTVGIGDAVTPGQLIGRLEDTTQRNTLQAAQADLFAAEGDLDRTEADYERHAQLLERGFVTRQRYDTALQTFRQAQARVDAASAQLANAKEALSFTALYADAAGIVTETGAEQGEVVSAGAMVVRVARDNGRDAVFDVPERVIDAVDISQSIKVALASDPAVAATGRVREISPQADPVTRTFRVSVGLSDIPQSFRLGSAVTGSASREGFTATPLPASAMTTDGGNPAVFVVDPETGTVALRTVEVGRFDLAEVQVTSGLADGDIVVTAGVQALRPGQQVRVGEGL